MTSPFTNIMVRFFHKRMHVARFESSSIEMSCCKKLQKNPNQETGLGNRGRLKVLNDTKLCLNEDELPP